MDFYCLARKDGIYDVICTRCFATVISTTDPSSIQEAQMVHRCTALKTTVMGSVLLGNELERSRARTPSMLARVKCARLPVLLVVAVLAMYAVPTVIEFVLLYSTHRWLDVVFAGDLLGCACIYLLLKKGHLAIAVYALITAVEATIYGLRLVPVRTLPWFADAVPTIIFIGLTRRLRKPGALRARNGI